MDVQFTKEAFQDYEFWKQHDIKKIERIKILITDIRNNHPKKGIGKPELLKHHKQGLWSRRINREHRLVYSVENNILTIYACRFHYD